MQMTNFGMGNNENAVIKSAIADSKAVERVRHMNSIYWNFERARVWNVGVLLIYFSNVTRIVLSICATLISNIAGYVIRETRVLYNNNK